jgi:cell division protein FtsB
MTTPHSLNNRQIALDQAVAAWHGRRPRVGGLTQAILATAAQFTQFLAAGGAVGSESDLDIRFDHLEDLMAASQADIDALTTAVTDLKTKVTDDTSALQTEIANLQAQGVDVTGLQAATADLSTAVDGVTALVPPATDQPPAA